MTISGEQGDIGGQIGSSLGQAVGGGGGILGGIATGLQKLFTLKKTRRREAAARLMHAKQQAQARSRVLAGAVGQAISPNVAGTGPTGGLGLGSQDDGPQSQTQAQPLQQQQAGAAPIFSGGGGDGGGELVADDARRNQLIQQLITVRSGGFF